MSELRLNTDGHIIKFGADNDVSLTHVADAGLLLNSTMKLQFNDATQFVQGTSATVLSIGATDEIDLTATAVDLNGTLDVSGNSQFNGTVTVGVNDTGKDVKLFGATASSHLLWDESADTLNLVASTLGVGAVGTKDLGAGIHIKTSDSSATANAAADELVIEANANSGISILSSTSTAGRIYFGDSGDDDIGQIRYNHDDNSMNFKTNTNDALKIDSAGNVTKPLQPVFLVRPSSDQADLATGATDVAWGAEIFDVGANFASNTFTAPVTGKYQFHVSLYLSNIDIDTTLFDVTLIASNRTQRLMAANFAKDFSADGNNFHSMNASTILDMDASDTISVRMNITGGGGVIHLNGGAPSSAFYTAWSGALIC